MIYQKIRVTLVMSLKNLMFKFEEITIESKMAV